MFSSSRSITHVPSWWQLSLAIAIFSLILIACNATSAPTESALSTPVEEPAPAEPIYTSAALLPTATAEPEQTSLPAPTQAAAPTPLPGIPEQRLLVLEWPSKIRVGDADIVRLSLEMDAQGNLTPTAYYEGNQVQSKPVEIPNLYATHNILAEASLEMAGMEYRPSGDISEALIPGQPVTFVWSVRPPDIGRYRGTLWLHLRFIPRQGGQETRTVLSAQLIEIEAVDFLGLGGATARILGSVGVVVGSVLGFDNLIPWFFKLVWPRKKASE